MFNQNLRNEIDIEKSAMLILYRGSSEIVKGIKLLYQEIGEQETTSYNIGSKHNLKKGDEKRREKGISDDKKIFTKRSSIVRISSNR